MNHNPLKHRNSIKDNLSEDQLDLLYWHKRQALKRGGIMREPNRRPEPTSNNRPRHAAHRSEPVKLVRDNSNNTRLNRGNK